LISDTLKPVPWKYVNATDLQTILSKKIAEGFVFPLNPKWILCDPGWKKIYNDLMASDALYAEMSKDVWFPPYSGVRERIEDIFKRHPNGFQPCTNTNKGKVDKSLRANLTGRRQSATNILRDTLDEAASELTGNAFADLAQLEFDDFVDRTSGNPSNKKSGMGANVMAAAASLTIEESEDEDHSSFFRSTSKPYEKRPSYVSHTGSLGSGSSDKYAVPNSNRSIGLDGKSIASSTSKPVRKLFKGAVSSTRKMFVPGKPAKKNHRIRTPGKISEMDRGIAGASNFSGFSDSLYPPKPSSNKFRHFSDPSPECEDQKQKKRTGWSKIRKNFNHPKSSN